MASDTVNLSFLEGSGCSLGAGRNGSPDREALSWGLNLVPRMRLMGVGRIKKGRSWRPPRG